jgi:hypothetical protein
MSKMLVRAILVILWSQMQVGPFYSVQQMCELFKMLLVQAEEIAAKEDEGHFSKICFELLVNLKSKLENQDIYR